MKTNRFLRILVVAALPSLTGYPQAPTAEQPTFQPPAQPAPAAPVSLSGNAAEVVRLGESGVGEEVVVAYVRNIQTPFNLSAQDILYLKDVGLTSGVITAMLNRDNELRGQPAVAVAPAFEGHAPAPSGPPPAEGPAVSPQVAPAPTGPPVGVAAGPAPVYVSNPPPEVSYFYNDLSPYGTWVQLEGVGWCWQPRVVVVNRGWRPYCDSGYWVFSDAGWYWQSEYSWGWAPFHYGRWHLHERCGWVWMPDRVWGPAWVTWRSGGDHCGWAPLPPHANFDVHLGYSFNGVHVGVDFDFGLHADHYTFVALQDFHQHDFAHHHLAPVQVKNIYTHTTIINNYVVNNNTVVNRGLPVERVSAATHTQFPKAVIHDLPAGRGNVAAAPGTAKGVIYRPQLTAPAKPVNMVAQRVDQTHPVVQHTPIVPPHTAPTPLRSPTAGVTGNSSKTMQPALPVSGSRTTVKTPQASASSEQKPPAKPYEAPRTANVSPLTPGKSTAPTTATLPKSYPAPKEPSVSAQTLSRSATSTSAQRPGANYQPDNGAYSLKNNTYSGQSKTGQAQSSTHSYYPKTYYQANQGKASTGPRQISPAPSQGQKPVVPPKPKEQ